MIFVDVFLLQLELKTSIFFFFFFFTLILELISGIVCNPIFLIYNKLQKGLLLLTVQLRSTLT